MERVSPPVALNCFVHRTRSGMPRPILWQPNLANQNDLSQQHSLAHDYHWDLCHNNFLSARHLKKHRDSAPFRTLTQLWLTDRNKYNVIIHRMCSSASTIVAATFSSTKYYYTIVVAILAAGIKKLVTASLVSSSTISISTSSSTSTKGWAKINTIFRGPYTFRNNSSEWLQSWCTKTAQLAL